MTSSAVFQLIYLYTAELFPTLIRNTAFGFSSIASGIGGVGAPFVIGLGGIIPLIVMGGLAIIGGLTGIFLPETIGLPLPHSLEQVLYQFMWLHQTKYVPHEYYYNVSRIIKVWRYQQFFYRCMDYGKIQNHGGNGSVKKSLHECVTRQSDN